MEMIKAGVQNEIVKLLSLNKYKVFLLLAGLLSIATGLLSTNVPLTVLAVATGFMLPLIIAMAAADLFTAEQENGSIKAILTRPVARISIFTSKVLAIILYAILVLLVCLVSSLVWSIVFNKTGLPNIAEILLAYSVSIIPMLPVILFAVVISQLCKNSSSTVMLSILGYIVLFGAGILLPGISPMLFTSYAGWYKMFIGVAMPAASILNILALLAAYTLIFFAVSSWAFEKKEY